MLHCVIVLSHQFCVGWLNGRVGLWGEGSCKEFKMFRFNELGNSKPFSIYNKETYLYKQYLRKIQMLVLTSTGPRVGWRNRIEAEMRKCKKKEQKDIKRERGRNEQLEGRF